MARPKKKKIIAVIIIILTIVNENLDDNITDSLEETVARQLRDGMCICDGDEDGVNWSGTCQNVYDVMEDIADAYDPNNMSSFDLDELSDNLQSALNEL